MNTANPLPAPQAGTFMSEGVECAATVHRPADVSTPGPVVVMAHGLGGVQALRLPAYARRFAARGYTVVTFDYRGFGDSGGEPRQVIEVPMQLADWRAALQHARTLDGVDPARVVAWGTSFSGGHVLTLAGAGEPLAAVVAQVPHVSGPAAVRATGVRASLRLAPSALRDRLAKARGRAPAYVPLVGRPGELGMMTSPDAVDGMERLIAESDDLDDSVRRDVAARIGLAIGRYSPGRRTGRISCPVLVQIAVNDAITPTRIAERAAAKIPMVSIRSFDGGHFDPYVDPLFDGVVADQVDFLERHVPL